MLHLNCQAIQLGVHPEALLPPPGTCCWQYARSLAESSGNSNPSHQSDTAKADSFSGTIQLDRLEETELLPKCFIYLVASLR